MSSTCWVPLRNQIQTLIQGLTIVWGPNPQRTGDPCAPAHVYNFTIEDTQFSSFVLLIIMFTVMQEFWWYCFGGNKAPLVSRFLSMLNAWLSFLHNKHGKVGMKSSLNRLCCSQLICLYYNHVLHVQTMSTLPPLVQLSQLFPPLHQGSPSSPPFCNYLLFWASKHLSTLCCRHLIWPLGIRSLTWDLGLHDPFTALKLSHQMCLAEKGFGVLIRARRGHVA